MNEICLPQNHHIIQILYEYLQKHGMNLDNPPTTKLFELFIQTHEITYQKKNFNQPNSIQKYSKSLKNQTLFKIILRDNIQRVKLHIELDLQESHLHKIEKSISEIHNDPSIIQKISDLTEGIKICRDRYLSIKEENEQFNKIQTTLTQQKQQLKIVINLQIQYQLNKAQDKIKNNLIQIDDLKEQSVSLNNRLIKQLKTVTELFQLNHKRTINQKHTNYVNNPIHNDDTSMILINLIEFLINLQMQILNKSGSNISSEDEILDLIQTILNLKSQLNQMKIQDNSEEQSKLTQQTESISIRQRFRYKTHHNLGEIKLSKHSQQGQDSKGTSQYDDEIMENQSSDNDCLQELIQISPKKPWQFKSVIIDSSKNSEKKMEYLSEQQIKSQNLKSLASISSDASFQDLRVTTLQEELQTVYSYDQTQGENIQVTSCCYDTQERTQINSKMESNLYDPDQTKCIQDQKNRRNFKITGFIMMTIGIAGWMYQRSK